MFLFGSGTLKIGKEVMVKDLCPMHAFPPASPPASFAKGQLRRTAKFMGLREIGISPTYR